MKNKKGMEKPIEIFVALFVILAVALLVLQLFQDQLGGVTTQLDEEEHRNRQETLMSRAVNYCRGQCPSTCTDQNMARFCLAKGNSVLSEYEYLDLNMNQQMDGDNTFLAGIYVCEDAVPCHALIDTCCGRTINHNTCYQILENFWTTTFGDDKSDWPTSMIDEGECAEANQPNSGHWYYEAGDGFDGWN